MPFSTGLGSWKGQRKHEASPLQVTLTGYQRCLVPTLGCRYIFEVQDGNGRVLFLWSTVVRETTSMVMSYTEEKLWKSSS